jgi:hypothetical protein
MRQKNIRHIVSVLLTILFTAACAAPAPTTPVQPTETQLPLTEAAATSAEATSTLEPGAPARTSGPVGGACMNTYYPVREGATWNYRSTGGPAGEYSFTDTVRAVRENGFTLTTQMGGQERSQEWDCTAEGLVARQLGGAPAAMLNSQGIQLNLDAVTPSGVIFPSQIDPGDQWQHTLDFNGDVSVMNEEAEATGTAQMNFTAIGEESVTVPAGTFEALKIQIDTTLNVEASYEGITLPVTFSGAYTYWFVQGVGWVKASGSGNLLSMSFTETTELQSYNIP